MTIDLNALLTANGAPTVPTIDQNALLDLHRQLADRAHEHQKFAHAAKVIASLSSIIASFPGADPRTVNLVVTSTITALRQPGTTNSNHELVIRYRTPQTWLDNLTIQSRAQQPRRRASR